MLTNNLIAYKQTQIIVNDFVQQKGKICYLLSDETSILGMLKGLQMLLYFKQ